jgi:hypothetical protein
MRTNGPSQTPGGSPSPTTPKSTPSDGSAKGATALLSQPRSTPGLAAGQTTRELENQVLETIEVTDSDLSFLAAERARRIKEYVLQSGQVEAERVAVAEKPDESKPAQGTRAMLHLR